MEITSAGAANGREKGRLIHSGIRDRWSLLQTARRLGAPPWRAALAAGNIPGGANKVQANNATASAVAS